MRGRIQDRVALVTGASSGLGRSICLKLASEGARIVCVDLYERPRNTTNQATGKADDFNNRVEGTQSTLQELHTLHGEDRATFVKANLTKSSDVEGAIQKCVEVFGRLDILCCNAGISVESTHPRPLGVHETSEKDWDKTMEINAKGVFLCCKYGLTQMLRQELLPGVKDRGWIVNTASIQGLAAYYNTRTFHPLPITPSILHHPALNASISGLHSKQTRRRRPHEANRPRLRSTPHPRQRHMSRLLTHDDDGESPK